MKKFNKIIAAMLMLVVIFGVFVSTNSYASDKAMRYFNDSRFNKKYTDEYGVKRELHVRYVDESWSKYGLKEWFVALEDKTLTPLQELPEDLPENYPHILHSSKAVREDMVSGGKQYPNSPSDTVYRATFYRDGSVKVEIDHRETGEAPSKPKEEEKPKKEEPKKETPKKEEPKKETPKKEEPKKETPKKEEPKKETSKKGEVKKEAPEEGAAKVDETKKEEPKKERVLEGPKREAIEKKLFLMEDRLTPKVVADVSEAMDKDNEDSQDSVNADEETIDDSSELDKADEEDGTSTLESAIKKEGFFSSIIAWFANLFGR